MNGWEEEINSLEQEIAKLRVERDTANVHCDTFQKSAERLRDALGMDLPWPLLDVLAKLVEATEHLLNQHNCDAHGHEEYRAAIEYGIEYLKQLRELRGPV